SNQVYVVCRTNPASMSVNPSGLTINVLDADTGADLWQLQTNGIPGNNRDGGIFPLSSIAVADDGRIYACSITNNNTVIVYCWDDGSSSTIPRVVFSDSPFPTANSGCRWGDTLAARGAGLTTQLILDVQNVNGPTNVAILTATNSSVTGMT